MGDWSCFFIAFIFYSVDKKKISSGAVAGIVIAVLIILLLALGIGWYCKKKRSNFYGPKQFNNPILYSSANTDGDEFEMQLWADIICRNYFLTSSKYDLFIKYARS